MIQFGTGKVLSATTLLTLLLLVAGCQVQLDEGNEDSAENTQGSSESTSGSSSGSSSSGSDDSDNSDTGSEDSGNDDSGDGASDGDGSGNGDSDGDSAGSGDSGSDESGSSDSGSEQDGNQTEPETQSATLSWSRPYERVNGEQLQHYEIGGYEIRYRRAEDEEYTTVVIEDSSAISHEIDDLPAGDYTFKIAAFDTDGLYSQFVIAEN